MSVDNLDPIASAFRTAMRLGGDFELRDEMSFDDIPGWDSLGHMNLVMELESRFGISLSMEDVATIDSVGAARTLANKQQAK
jgi:acyl carrier protein